MRAEPEVASPGARPESTGGARWIPPLGVAGSAGLAAAMTLVGLGAEMLPAPEQLRRVAAGFVALFVGVWLLRGEALDGTDWWRERVRLRAPSGRDWAVIGGGTVLAVVIAALLTAVLPEMLPSLASATLTSDDRPRTNPALFLLPFALAQVLGDEWLWRGVVLPRHEAVGPFGWLQNGATWLAVQVAVVGILPLAINLPLALVLPLAAHITRNTYVPLAIRSALVVAVLS